MPLKWIAFKIALRVSLCLCIGSLIWVLWMVGKFNWEQYSHWENIAIYLCLVVFISFSTSLSGILKKKFPDGSLSNADQGLIYFMIVFNFIACTWLLIYYVMALPTIINLFQTKNLFVVAIAIFSSMNLAILVCNIYLASLAIGLLKLLNRNRRKILQDIHKIGNN